MSLIKRHGSGGLRQYIGDRFIGVSGCMVAIGRCLGQAVSVSIALALLI
ncbi:hypothetical protein [Almyronema epifaneia]|uniref:Uncharacterized protein n=1 Tax=Almyronema epifaneia S1 TaxID=2991925 RepID=A0ABW6IKJ4_9CYAN